MYPAISAWIGSALLSGNLYLQRPVAIEELSKMTEFQFDDAALKNLKGKVAIVTGTTITSSVPILWLINQVDRAVSGEGLSNT
jgi:hypothetical protein